MERGLQGNYITISTVDEKVKAFVPNPLPPKPPVDWTPDLRDKFDHALMALGRLDSVSTLLPETLLFLYMYVRKEAVLSSMIVPEESSRTANPVAMSPSTRRRPSTTAPSVGFKSRSRVPSGAR